MEVVVVGELGQGRGDFFNLILMGIEFSIKRVKCKLCKEFFEMNL